MGARVRRTAAPDREVPEFRQLDAQGGQGGNGGAADGREARCQLAPCLPSVRALRQTAAGARWPIVSPATAA
ncbi:hypothetical protein GCM10009706_22130 [Curtobacterium citreum]|nr:hypothetical protein GCM10009706_22130 [Curtobacterium citreum]